MKIKRFLASDIRKALQQVKETLGPDAVILSNRKTEEGVEIVAARDFDLEVVSAPPASSPSKPVAKVETSLSPQKTRVTPKPAFSARGYRAVADMVHDVSSAAAGQEQSKKPVVSKAKRKNHRTVRSTTRSPQQSPRYPVTGDIGEQQVGRLSVGKLEDKESFGILRRELQAMRRLLDGHISQSAWHEELRHNPTRLDLLRALNNLGFSRSMALELAQRGGTEVEFSDAWEEVQRVLTDQLPILDDTLLDYGGVVALVGPTGVGKTTTIAKLAARFRLKHGPRQIALVSTDNYRIAAHEQLGTYARILGVPVRVAGNPDELHTILRGFMDKKLVLIDTAGMSQRDMNLAGQFSLLEDSKMAIETYLVLSASAQLGSLREAIDAFSGFHPKACILTKLDEAGSLAPSLSVLMERGLPAAFVTDGQQVPEDLHPADSETLVTRGFETGTQTGFHPDMGHGFEDWVANASV